MNHMDHARTHTQRGVLLILCAIFMFLISIIAIAAMDMSVVQQKQVRNILFYMQSFQTANHELQQQYEALVEDDGALNEAVSESKSLAPILDIENATQTSSMTYLGSENAPAGYSIGKYSGYLYEINTMATHQNVDAVSDQTLGFKYAAPQSY